MTKKELETKVNAARWWLLNNQPFYGALAMGLPDTIGNPHGQTACTDGARIYWDEKFLATLTNEQTRFVLAHETLHCAHEHGWRLPAREVEAQHACDHAINLTLRQISGMEMPKGGLADPRFTGLAEERIYSALKSAPDPKNGKPSDGKSGQSPGPGAKPQPDPNGKPGQSPGKPDPQGKPGPGAAPPIPDPTGCGSFCEPASDPKPTPGAKPRVGAQTLREQWQERVIQAQISAKALGRGDLPGDLQRVLERIARCDIDWRQELADFARTVIGARNDWSRSNRRMATQPVIYPRRRPEDLGVLIAIRDTSGSIDDALCAEFTALIASAAAEIAAETIVLDVDTGIRGEYRLSRGELPPLTAKGGGGTDFAQCVPARLEELREAGEQIAGVIVLTDLDGSDFDPSPSPALILSTTNTQSAFARTVRIEG